jgi:hypothetical protein
MPFDNTLNSRVPHPAPIEAAPVGFPWARGKRKRPIGSFDPIAINDKTRVDNAGNLFICQFFIDSFAGVRKFAATSKGAFKIHLYLLLGRLGLASVAETKYLPIKVACQQMLKGLIAKNC